MRLYRSLKFPRVSVLIIGSRKTRKVEKQWRVDGYEESYGAEVGSLANALRISREIDSGSLVESRTGVQEQNVFRFGPKNGVESRVRRVDRKDKRQASKQPVPELRGPRRVRPGPQEARDQGRGVHKVRRVKDRTRVQGRAR